MIRGTHQERTDDGEGDRQGDCDLGSNPRLAVHVNDAAQLADVVLDDVHADAPPAQIVDGFGGTQTWKEYQTQHLRTRELAGLLGRDFTKANCPIDDRQLIDATPVILDLEHDVVALLERIERDGPNCRLSNLGTLL